MNRPLALAFLVCLALACTPKRVIQASATIEDLPNEPEDAGVAAAAPAGPAAPAPAPAPTKRVELTEGFSAEFPADPVVQRSVGQSKNGPVPAVTVSVNVGGVLYVITRQDYPEATVSKAGPKKMLTQSRLDVTREMKDPRISDEKDVELAGFPGKTFSVVGMVNGADRVVKARSAVVQNSLYTMVVVFTGPPPGNADAFLASLELKNPPPAPAPAPTPAPAPAKP